MPSAIGIGGAVLVAVLAWKAPFTTSKGAVMGGCAKGLIGRELRSPNGTGTRPSHHLAALFSTKWVPSSFELIPKPTLRVKTSYVK